MEITNIDSKVFEEMISAFESFVSKVKELCKRNTPEKAGRWLDNQDVCLLLNISPRTLQTYRDKGILKYSRINNKMFYKEKDIQAVLDEKRKTIK